MAFDLDNAVGQFLAWEFPVEIGGKVYRTRPIKLGEVFALAGEASGDRLRELILGLFEGAKPDLSGWTMDHVQAFIAAIQDYAAERAKKNAPVMKKLLANR